MKLYSLLFLSLVFIFVSCKKENAETVNLYYNGHYPQFENKTAGQIHNIILNDMLFKIPVKSLANDSEISLAIKNYLITNYPDNMIDMPQPYYKYSEPSTIVEHFTLVDEKHSKEYQFMLGIYNELSEMDSYEESIEVIEKYEILLKSNNSKVLDKSMLFSSLDVYKHSLKFWFIDFKAHNTRSMRTEDASCTQKVALADAVGYIFGNAVGAAASSLVTYGSTCN